MDLQTEFDIQGAKWSVEYHKPKEIEHSAAEEPIFGQIMHVLRNKGLTDDERNLVIHLYVQAINAKFWEGWHSHGVAMGQQVIDKYEVLEESV